MTLFEAVAAADVDAAQHCLATGEDVNQLGPSQRTPLIEAAAAGHLELVELLLGSGAEPMCRDAEKETALLKAAANGHRRVVAMLLPLADRDEADLARSFLSALAKTEEDEAFPREPRTPNPREAPGPKAAKAVDGMKEKAATFGARAARFFGNVGPQERLDRVERSRALDDPKAKPPKR